MTLPRLRDAAVALVVSTALFAPAAAVADTDSESGGAAAPSAVEVSLARCSTGQLWACKPGKRLVVEGEGLNAVDRVEFLGSRGKSDDRVASPLKQRAHSLVVVVPAGAQSGRLRARSALVRPGVSRRAVSIARPVAATPPAGADGVFPIAGKHDLGQSETNNFGGGRGHQGQDLFAACGTPLVAPVAATVKERRTDGRAGNYLVLEDAQGQSYVFMHMRDPAVVAKSAAVAAGEQIGYVGQSGNAQGCHLHFEIWSAPGWYTGGTAIDPLPALKRWDAAHTHAARQK